MKTVFQMPRPVKITGRTSSITNAFVNGIIPVINPTDQEINEVLQTLGMDSEHVVCAYCGDPYTEWDHFHPLVEGKKPTGYISEIHNLVPSCSKCNQSKGNKYWKTWMMSDANYSPHSRNIPDIEYRIQKLEEFERRYPPIKLDFEKIVGAQSWEHHWENCRKIHDLMRESQEYSDEIKKCILDFVKKQA